MEGGRHGADAEQLSHRKTQCRVKAKMTARLEEVLGSVQGNMEASDRVDVRSDGPLTQFAGTSDGGIMIGPAYMLVFVPIMRPFQGREGRM
jgi:hypothetical protein